MERKLTRWHSLAGCGGRLMEAASRGVCSFVSRGVRSPALGVALLGACVFAAPAAPPPDYGFEWATIGDPGNRPTNPDEMPWNPDRRIGAVDYTYRISKLEVTNTQYREFLQAYAPYWAGHFVHLAYPLAFSQDSGGTVHIRPGYEPAAVRTGWVFAAMYCNWLHNGMVSEAWAFESGAYDTSDWVYDPNSPVQFSGTTTRMEGAQFWIPNEDEWVKAVYYDPYKNGLGEEGYWRHPNMSDEPVPIDQTSSTMFWPDHPPAVGMFPDTLSPWGLLDASGGGSEWMENRLNMTSVFQVRGSSAGDLQWGNLDAVDWQSWHSFAFIGKGLRIASDVPSSSTLIIACCAVATCRFRKRRKI